MARTVPEGIRLTKVGGWYIALTLIVGVAAANTGNNALYLVEALLLATLVLSGLTSRRNVRGLDVDLELPDEAYAHQPFRAAYRLANRDPLAARRLVVVTVDGGSAALVPFLARRGETSGHLEMLAKRRGMMSVASAHLHSLFPLGLFRKGVRVRLGREILVFPELYPAAREGASQAGQAGDRPSRRKGWGHELLGLRRFQPGDDRRSIHWKRSAQLGELVFMERESEQGRRLSIALDNGVGELAGHSQEMRFERLVSEAATAAHDYLARGYEVELITRGGRIPFGVGRSQRHRILRELALLQPAARGTEPLLPPEDRMPRLKLALEPGATT